MNHGTYKNNLSVVLTQACTDTDTVLHIDNAGAIPVLNEHGLYLTFVDTNEIVEVTSVDTTNNTITVVRGLTSFGGSSASSHNSGTKLSARVIAEHFDNLENNIENNEATINSHVNNTSNPHNVTPSQIGAITKVEDDTSPKLGGELDAQSHSIGFTLQTYTGNVGTTTIDWTKGNKAKFTFGSGNETLVFTAPSKPCNLLLMVIQDSTGGRTLTFPSNVKWAGGTAPTLSTSGGAIDIISFFYDGVNYYGVASLDFS